MRGTDRRVRRRPRLAFCQRPAQPGAAISDPPLVIQDSPSSAAAFPRAEAPMPTHGAAADHDRDRAGGARWSTGAIGVSSTRSSVTRDATEKRRWRRRSADRLPGDLRASGPLDNWLRCEARRPFLRRLPGRGAPIVCSFCPTEHLRLAARVWNQQRFRVRRSASSWVLILWSFVALWSKSLWSASARSGTPQVTLQSSDIGNTFSRSAG